MISKYEHFIPIFSGRDVNLVQYKKILGFVFPVGKCVRMNFCRSLQDAPVFLQHFFVEQPILDVDSHKDLGVGIDFPLKFHPRVRDIADKVSGISFSILKGTICGTPNFMEGFYQTF